MTKPDLDRQIAALVDKVIKDRTLAKYLKADAVRGRQRLERADEKSAERDEAAEWDNLPV